MLRFSKWIDSINERIGRALLWLSLGIILLAAYNAIMRYFSKMFGINLSSNAVIEIQWYLFSVMFLLSGGYALQKNSHVRVDVFYDKFSPKKRIYIEILGSIFLLIPFSFVSMIVSIQPAINSWKVWEVSADPGGLPRYPIKTIVPLAFLLLLLQGISDLIKNMHRLRNGENANDLKKGEY